ncbi:hypothetical protein [Paenibacillus xylanexedens]|uniref:hypothetical protein n=1 Tax=Paenibacillus xylanexedens TaxID=528191 RepID=UPI0016434698|nr:hypothetical protein [Paenibacillus xylanexedens]
MNKGGFVIGSGGTVGEEVYELGKRSLVDEMMIGDFYGNEESGMKGDGLVGNELM